MQHKTIVHNNRMILTEHVEQGSDNNKGLIHETFNNLQQCEVCLSISNNSILNIVLGEHTQVQ